jgi:hypothetical protein
MSEAPTRPGAPAADHRRPAKEPALSATARAREDRIELRATKEEKRLLATAAAYERFEMIKSAPSSTGAVALERQAPPQSFFSPSRGAPG